MIELIRFRDVAAAQLALKVLAQRGVQGQLHQQDGDSVIVLDEPEQFDLARTTLDDWLANPNDPQFNQAAWNSNQALTQSGKVSLGASGWWQQLGLLTRLVFVICVAVYASRWFMGWQLYEWLFFADSWQGIAAQPWRVLTPMFLHLSALHIIFNMLWWMDLGAMVERVQSTRQLLLVTVITSLAANILQFSVTGPNFGGLSGVVYGLLGYIWMYSRTNPASGLMIRKPVVVFMLIWLVVCWVGLSGMVANEAHFGGLASGCVLGVLFGSRDRLAANNA